MEKHLFDAVVIPLSKGKIFLLVLGSLVFVSAGAWMWSFAESKSPVDEYFLKSIGLASISFFGLCTIYGFAKLFDNRPGLVIDSEGIIDHSSGVAAGRIHWDEITGIAASEVAGQRFLIIKVIDPSKYTKRGFFFQRWLNASSINLTGSPINISSHALSVTFDNLVHLLITAFEKSRQQAQTNAAVDWTRRKGGPNRW